MSCVNKLDDELQKILYELEEMMVPGILQKFCQLVGPRIYHTEETMKVRQYWAAQMTLQWAKEQLETTKLADELQRLFVK
jgi:hypothetical protein